MDDDDATTENAAEIENEMIAAAQSLIQDFGYTREDIDRALDSAEVI